ncbi:hypothetical protein N9U05_00070 [bacterium]|nr:hypothetical protein [bacterium]
MTYDHSVAVVSVVLHSFDEPMHCIFHSVIRAEPQLLRLHPFTWRHDRLQGLRAVIQYLLIQLAHHV